MARCVYQGDGVISDAGRRRFDRVCESLGLPKDAPRTISRNYRQGLDGQWARLRRLVTGLNYFAEVMVFDLRELETVRDLLERLSRFDPRRRGQQLRGDLLARLGQDTGSWISRQPSRGGITGDGLRTGAGRPGKQRRAPPPGRRLRWPSRVAAGAVRCRRPTVAHQPRARRSYLPGAPGRTGRVQARLKTTD